MVQKPAWASMGCTQSFSGELSVNQSETHGMCFPWSPHMELDIQGRGEIWEGWGVEGQGKNMFYGTNQVQKVPEGIA